MLRIKTLAVWRKTDKVLSSGFPILLDRDRDPGALLLLFSSFLAEALAAKRRLMRVLPALFCAGVRGRGLASWARSSRCM